MRDAEAVRVHPREARRLEIRRRSCRKFSQKRIKNKLAELQRVLNISCTHARAARFVLPLTALSMAGLGLILKAPARPRNVIAAYSIRAFIRQY